MVSVRKVRRVILNNSQGLGFKGVFGVVLWHAFGPAEGATRRNRFRRSRALFLKACAVSCERIPYSKSCSRLGPVHVPYPKPPEPIFGFTRIPASVVSHCLGSTLAGIVADMSSCYYYSSRSFSYCCYCYVSYDYFYYYYFHEYLLLLLLM